MARPYAIGDAAPQRLPSRMPPPDAIENIRGHDTTSASSSSARHAASRSFSRHCRKTTTRGTDTFCCVIGYSTIIAAQVPSTHSGVSFPQAHGSSPARLSRTLTKLFARLHDVFPCHVPQPHSHLITPVEHLHAGLQSPPSVIALEL